MIVSVGVEDNGEVRAFVRESEIVFCSTRNGEYSLWFSNRDDARAFARAVLKAAIDDSLLALPVPVLIGGEGETD